MKPHNQIQRVRELYFRGFKFLYAKMWNLYFFARRKIRDVCLFVFCYLFVRGDCTDPVVLEYFERAHSAEN